LRALEAVAKDALKCLRVRAFLVSSPFIGLPPGRLLYLKRSTCTGLTHSTTSLECRSGIPYSLFLSHTHSLSIIASLSITLYLNYSLSPSLSRSFSLTLSLTLSLPPTLSLTHSLSYSLSHTHSLSHLLFWHTVSTSVGIAGCVAEDSKWIGLGFSVSR
jgi:hypothetical protein